MRVRIEVAQQSFILSYISVALGKGVFSFAPTCSVLSLCSCSFVERIALKVVGRSGHDAIFPLSTSSIGSQFVCVVFSFIVFRMYPIFTLNSFRPNRSALVPESLMPMRFKTELLSSSEGLVARTTFTTCLSGCSFVTKASFAQAAGAVAFISYDYQNNSARILNMLPDESSTKVWIPCAFMQGSHAQHLLELMELDNKTYLDVDFPVDRTGSLIILDKYSPMRLR
ncbi:unnamed protein product [Taenia asiatica]|uniref:PA domain-containing protein n=1 Tax=Taenia asiatica TaxID=60517 RepID=A0A0R3W2N4_TAEAS|nr:unnamed protein product [Taenia asiatica]